MSSRKHRRAQRAAQQRAEQTARRSNERAQRQADRDSMPLAGGAPLNPDVDKIPLAVYGPRDERAVQQLRNCIMYGDAVGAALMADHHVGYSQPIGGVVAYENFVSPSGVGYDIACLAQGTPVTSADGYYLPIEKVAPEETVLGWDGQRLRTIEPCLGAVAKGRREVRRVSFGDGRHILVTADHRLRTETGWSEAGSLHVGDTVACSPFVGQPWEPVTAVQLQRGISEPDSRHHACSSREAELRNKGLWPLPTENALLAPLLRVFGYCLGDGHLSLSGKAVDFYTSVETDAHTLVADLNKLGFSASLSSRERPGVNVRRQWLIRVNSVAFHALLEAMGCPVGRKVISWDRSVLAWVFDLPLWCRSVLLSAFASAEASTPAFHAGSSRMAAVAMKQSGVTDDGVQFIADLLRSLDYRASVTLSAGPSADGVSSWIVTVLGGASESMRFLREIGFNRAVDKRVAAARMLSAYTQLLAHADHRANAIERFVTLVGAGAPVGATSLQVATDENVPPSLLLHGRQGRGAPRSSKHWRPTPHTAGEVAWLPITDISPGGSENVYDVVTNDAAATFMAAGVVVHNCGLKGVKTNLKVEDVPVRPVMDELVRRISFGVGRRNDEGADSAVLDHIRDANFEPQRALLDMSAQQLGTVGSGNHFVNLMADEEDNVWVVCHFGSRGFGHRTASGFLALAQGKAFDDRVKDGEMDSPPVLLDTRTELGQAYVEAMNLAGEYAYAGRDWVCDRVVQILGAQIVDEVHQHHNFAWRETLPNGTDAWVIRKGATPAFPGQRGIVGSSMEGNTVVIEGVDNPDAQATLNSTVHGSGRVMSRTQAAGKWKKVWTCSSPGCTATLNLPPGNQHPKKGACPKHQQATPRKRRVRVGASVDFNAVQKRLEAQGIVLKGAGADEAPEVYKNLNDVLGAHQGQIAVVRTLRPLGVAMAGPETVDPFKD